MAHDFLYGTRTRRVASAGLDGLTPILLVAYVLGAVGAGVYAQTQFAKLAEQGQPTVSPSVLWTSLVLGVVMLFAITGPMVLLGVFIASKIMKFPLSGAAYLKACGVAALPALMMALANVLPQNVALRLLVVLAIIPAVFFVIKTTFELTFGEGAVTFVLSGITGVIGLVISGLIIGAVAFVGVVSEQQGVAGAGGNQTVSSLPKLPGVTGPKIQPGATNAGPTKSAADLFRDTLAARYAQTPDTSREQQQKELAELKARAAQVGVASRDDVQAMLNQLEQRAAAAPSEQPDAALFEELAGGAAWRPSEAQLAQVHADETSYKNVNFRLPKGFRVDFATAGDGEKGMSFSTGRPDSGKLTLRTVSATNAKQRRPWVIMQKVQLAAAERENLFTIDGAGGTIDQGTINGMPFTRVLHEPGKRWGVHGRSAQYVTRTADGWLIAEAVASSSGDGGIGAMESAIRTLRPRPAGEPVRDPLGPDALAARLAEDPDRVAALLRAKGRAAEDAVIPQLTNADARAARAAAEVLADIGSEKSVPALQEAARSSDTWLANAARDAIKKLKPADDVENALLDLESGNVLKKREALQRLAKAAPAPDDARREKVAAAIEKEVLGDNLFSLSDDIGPAMGAWAGKTTVPKLLPLLDENASHYQRKVAMEVFAKTKDKKTVFPVVRWIIKDTDNVTKCLTEMGPVAEDEVIKLTKEADAKVRTAAARILQEIGTGKSLSPLKRAAQDPRDAGAAAAARVALDIVNERWKATKATTGPTTGPAR